MEPILYCRGWRCYQKTTVKTVKMGGWVEDDGRLERGLKFEALFCEQKNGKGMLMFEFWWNLSKSCSEIRFTVRN